MSLIKNPYSSRRIRHRLRPRTRGALAEVFFEELYDKGVLGLSQRIMQTSNQGRKLKQAINASIFDRESLTLFKLQVGQPGSSFRSKWPATTAFLPSSFLEPKKMDSRKVELDSSLANSKKNHRFKTRLDNGQK